MNLDLVKSPISDLEKHDVEHEAPEIVETVGVFDSDILAIGTSGVKYNAPAHDNVSTDSLSNLDEDKDKLTVPLSMPPVSGEVKKRGI